MKFLGRFRPMALGAAMVATACTGSGSKPTDQKPDLDTDSELPPADSDAWTRNPAKTMACEQPLTMNEAAYPLQRLTNVELANTVRDLLSGIADSAKLVRSTDLPPESRVAGFSNNALQQQPDRGYADAIEQLAIGAAREAVKDLSKLGCAKEDGSCIGDLISGFGKRVFRRPLTSGEISDLKKVYEEARAEPLKFSHAMAVETVVGTMLQSPQFLFRLEEGQGTISDKKSQPLSNWEMASRLSYLIWDSMPDDDLFRAAEAGELMQSEKIEAQARRMLGDDRARGAMKEFFDEWLDNKRYSAFVAAPAKDREFYPTYDEKQAKALIEGRDKFIEEAFFGGDHSMTQLFSSTKGWVNDDVAYIYGVDKPGSAELKEVELNPAQRKGILTNPAIMAGMSHTTEQAPILRGGFIMERLLCAPSPPPPPGIITQIPFDENEAMTYRQRVEKTAEQGKCANCHKPLDSFGFLFENYNSIGAFQTEEQAKFKGMVYKLPTNAKSTIMDTLDVNGEFDNAIPFVEKMGKSKQVAQCVVEHLWSWANARREVDEDGCAVVPLTTSFIENKFDMQKLVVDLVKNPSFRVRRVAAE
ncbi:MAG: DUF1592 domain-containing protein [Deltaproteobacteria bacterium]|nr:DUF1592 domain-containing protein [Deltaproteobacteria bacterium]